jgi:hypothetical protein
MSRVLKMRDEMRQGAMGALGVVEPTPVEIRAARAEMRKDDALNRKLAHRRRDLVEGVISTFRRERQEQALAKERREQRIEEERVVIKRMKKYEEEFDLAKSRDQAQRMDDLRELADILFQTTEASFSREPGTSEVRDHSGNVLLTVDHPGGE